MILRKVALFVMLFLSISFAQDTIRGTYSYTYGDSESLVEARQTCKDLAIREAIESYYIFVQSSTEVENFQLKEDIVNTIAAGYLKNINIVDQKEEGRTITITIEATVDPDKIKEVVDTIINKKSAEEKETEAEKDTTDELESEEPIEAGSGEFFLNLINRYEKRFQDIGNLVREKRYQEAENMAVDLKLTIERYRPSGDNYFHDLLYRAIKNHMLVVVYVIKAEKYENRGQIFRARANWRQASKKAKYLRTSVNMLKDFENLNAKQSEIRDYWVRRCERILDRIKRRNRILRKGING